MIFKYKDFLLEKQRDGGKRIEDFSDLYVERVSKKLGYKLIKKLTNGLFGVAYLLDKKKVLKFTTDQSEYLNSKSLIGKDLEHFPTFYYAKELGLKNSIKSRSDSLLEKVYIILMDYIPKADIKEIGCFDDGGLEFIDDYISIDGDVETGTILGRKIEGFLKHSDSEIEEEMKTFFEDNMKCFHILKKYIPQLRSFRKELMENDIDSLDFHTGNMGIKDGKIIYYDLGVSTIHKYTNDSITLENDFDEFRKITEYRYKNKKGISLNNDLLIIPLDDLIDDLSKKLNVNRVKSYKVIRDEIYHNDEYSFVVIEKGKKPIMSNLEINNFISDLSRVGNLKKYDIFIYLEKK